MKHPGGFIQGASPACIVAIYINLEEGKVGGPSYQQ
jgi:hypothetical protein